jgi:hypothetical protein
VEKPVENFLSTALKNSKVTVIKRVFRDSEMNLWKCLKLFSKEKFA